MATKKIVKKRCLTKSEYKRFIETLEKARRMAWKMSRDDRYIPEVKRSFASIEKKLSAIRVNYYWGRMTNYEA